ncbi:SsgA family sporulation/cell division regulator [Streptomyces sp. NPDC002133]|uniref:SsgA family sporulation/cell division regulator n=1 Tax=Streptomyces sp. NPDC002133 TaxID=3154409 RepID=UPI003317914F
MESLKTLVLGCVSVRLVVSGEPPLSLHMRLQYEATDPYVVRAAFTLADGDEAVEWNLGRDLLAEGLIGPAGEADVRMWPARRPGRSVLYLALGSPEHAALLELPAQDMRTFLQATETVVPQGTESGHIDWDTELARLCAES